MGRRTAAADRLLAAVSAFALLIALLAGAPSASAVPPSSNGQLAYDRVDPANPDNQFVISANVHGQHEQLVASNTCCPGWSPNGHRLAIPRAIEDGRIGCATVNADGSDYTPLPIDDRTLNVGCGTGSWSPNGTRLVAESWDDSTPGRNGLYTFSPLDGHGLTRVTSNPLGGHDIPGAYSPNGKRIVFIRFDQDGNSAGIFTVRPSGNGLRQVMPADSLLNIGVDWSPHGNEILFSLHVTPDARGSIWIVHANGTGLHELSIQGLPCGGLLTDPDSMGCHGPRWSPDGRQIVFTANTATASNIYTAHSDGTGLCQVTFDGGSDDPDWGSSSR